jgi:CheY-like chemotaxis protein
MPHTLLLADDSLTVQRVIELTFADEGVRVIAVSDGAAAIDRIEREAPDIVLADIGMPNRDGYEVASFVKTRPDLAHIPVVLLAGAFEPVDQSRAAAVGCDGVLVKPFEPHLVIARVKELLAGGPSRVRPVGQLSPPADEPAHRVESPDELFMRLDQAFSRLGVPTDPTPVSPPLAAPEARAATVWEVAAGSTDVDLSKRDGDVSAPNLLAAAFRTLLAGDRGESLRPGPAGAGSPGQPLDEADVERVVARVLERLKEGDLRDAATSVVTPIVERLVRDEIARIKSSH